MFLLLCPSIVLCRRAATCHAAPNNYSMSTSKAVARAEQLDTWHDFQGLGVHMLKAYQRVCDCLCHQACHAPKHQSDSYRQLLRPLLLLLLLFCCLRLLHCCLKGRGWRQLVLLCVLLLLLLQWRLRLWCLHCWRRLTLLLLLLLQ